MVVVKDARAADRFNNYSLGLWVPAFAGATKWREPSSIPARWRLNEAAIVGRADQDLVDANPRRHAGDEGDGAAAILGLQHFGLLGLARHDRTQLQDRCRHLARR